MPKIRGLVPIYGELDRMDFVIDSAAWSRVEEVSRYRLKAALREQITAETTRFLMLLPSKAPITTSKKVVRLIRSAARKLHAAITHCSPKNLDADFWAKHLIQTNMPVPANMSIGQMACSIVKACDRAEAYLDNPTHLELKAGGKGSTIVKSAIMHNRSAWAVWVCNLAHTPDGERSESHGREG
jgi:hypothetical protein